MDTSISPRLIISAISLALAILLAQSSSVSSQTSSNQASTCHLRELDLCAASLLVLTRSQSGLATNEQAINKQCGHLKEADVCFRNYTRRCMTPMQRELVMFAANNSLQIVNEYCTRGSQLRTNYLKHATCLNQVQKRDQKVCLNDLQVSLDVLVSGLEHQPKRFQLACCAYRKFEACIGGQLDKRCGKEALNFVGSIFRRVSFQLPETMCRNYKPDGLECRALLPKSGSVPKGSKSNSILSRLLSAYSDL